MKLFDDGRFQQLVPDNNYTNAKTLHGISVPTGFEAVIFFNSTLLVKR